MATTNPAFITRVLELTNQFRAQNGRSALKLNAELNATAQNHSADMANQDYFSHTGKNGSAPWDRAELVGYKANFMGENIAAGYGTPEAVVQGWIDSPGHRANLLNANFTELGVGYFYLANDTGSVNYNAYWTQVFGSGDTNPASNLPVPSPSPSPAPSPSPSPSPSPAPSNDEIIGTATGETLTGNDNNNRIFGNGGSDILTGGNGNDWLNGGSGNDRMTGGAGQDNFVFDSNRAFSTATFGLDRITDFVRGTDKIVLDQTSFGNISSNQIAVVNRDTQASRSSGRVVYSLGSGRLFFNANGTSMGLGRGGAFAVIDSDGNSSTAAPALSSSDFQIVA